MTLQSNGVIGFMDWLDLFVEIQDGHMKNCAVQSIADIASGDK
jgi:hypothetical protein